MNKMRADAIRSEFPGASKVIFCRASDGSERDIAACDGVLIRRIDHDLLQIVPSEYTWGGSSVDIDEWDEIAFVLKDGSIIREAVRPDSTSGSSYTHSEEYMSGGETVLDSIYRHEIASNLSEIVRIQGGYNVVEHCSLTNWKATIYKLPKSFTIQDIVVAAANAALARVRAESESPK